MQNPSLKRRNHFHTLIALLVTASLLLSACGPAESEATPTPTKTPEPAVQEPASTATPVPDQASQSQPTEETQPTATSGVSPSPTPQPVTATVTATELNVRSGPGTNYGIVRAVASGQQFDVVAVSQDGDWVQVAENGQTIGWTALRFLDVQGDLASLAQDESVASAGQNEGGNQPAQEPTEPPAQQPTPQPASSGSGSYLPATMQSPDYGAQAFLWWRPEIADRDLTLMQEAGFNWVKQAFGWETIEGAGKGQYDWSNADRVVRQVNASGLKLLARVSSDPDLQDFWAGHPPENANDFADFLFALASRYNCTAQAVGCIQAYQVWNEPNLGREWGGNRPNPAQYVTFLGKAYQAIKRANPNAIVINAGMAPTGDDNAVAMPDDKFYDQMYQAMGGNSDGYFDMLGVHGAGFAAPPELDPAEAAANQKYGGYRFFAFRHVEDIRQIMVRYGDSDKKIVILEFGWTSDPVNPSYKWHGADAGIDEMVKADYLKRAYQYAEANWQPWIGLMSLLTMPNLDWLNDGNPQDEEQYWWAIMEPSPVNELNLRAAYVVLCIYFNQQKGQICKYDPSRQ